MKKEEKSVANIIIKIIIAFLVVPILIITCVVGIKGCTNPDKIPDFMGYKPFIVLSGSMETAIYTGDLVLVKICNTNDLKINDIIAFRNEEDTVTTHRIMEVINQNGETLFKTKGDNNNSSDDDLVKADDVEGIFAFKISGLGNLLIAIKEPKTLIIILLAIALCGTVCLYISNKVEEKKTKEENR